LNAKNDNHRNIHSIMNVTLNNPLSPQPRERERDGQLCKRNELFTSDQDDTLSVNIHIDCNCSRLSERSCVRISISIIIMNSVVILVDPHSPFVKQTMMPVQPTRAHSIISCNHNYCLFMHFCELLS
jgi:hypothetical protein